MLVAFIYKMTQAKSPLIGTAFLQESPKPVGVVLKKIRLTPIAQ